LPWQAAHTGLVKPRARGKCLGRRGPGWPEASPQRNRRFLAGSLHVVGALFSSAKIRARVGPRHLLRARGRAPKTRQDPAEEREAQAKQRTSAFEVRRPRRARGSRVELSSEAILGAELSPEAAFKSGALETPSLMVASGDNPIPVWSGLVSGLVWSGLVWSGLVWPVVWSSLVWSGLVWFGLIWSGLVWSGLVWSGLV
jgi:hypothetical protein